MATNNKYQEIPCNVVVSNNFDTCGTVTRASINHLTSDQLLDLFKPSGLFADMDAWFRTSFEMKACGTKTNGLYDWIMSSQRDMSGFKAVVPIDRGKSLLMPFVMGRQDSVINKDYWAITGGAANSAYTGDLPATAAGTYTAGPLTTADKALGAASDRVIRVVSRYGLDLDAKWFVDKDRVYISSVSGGQSLHGQWKVLASEVSTDLSYIDVLIKSENVGSTPFASAPTSGVLEAGGNNVSDFESWCKNRPTLDPRKRVPYWFQTMRRSRCVDSEYKKVFARLMESNEFFREFGDLPLSERNRQDEEEYQRRQLNSMFFGKKISANQTMLLWQSLEQILTVTGSTVDPGLGGKLVAYRANMIGVREQLQACGQVRDLQNNKLNIYEFLLENYNIMRARDSQGKVVDSIDWFTDTLTASNFMSGMVEYFKKEFGDIVRIAIEPEVGYNAELGFRWNTYSVKYPAGLKINIITHKFFDDRVNAFNRENIAYSGRLLLALEIGKPGNKGGTIYPGMIASNRKMRTLGELEQLGRLDPTFACVMEHVTEEITLTSDTSTIVVECPQNSLWIEGASDGIPTVTAPSSPYSDLYV